LLRPVADSGAAMEKQAARVGARRCRARPTNRDVPVARGAPQAATPTNEEPFATISEGNQSRMHGEYKTPNGKLIAVDFEVENDKLKDVMISGDFFLYPEEALTDLTDALEGLAVELSESEISERVRMALPRDAELLGSSPEAIGAAVRRALAADEETGDDDG